MTKVLPEIKHRSVLGWVVGIIVLAAGVMGFQEIGEALGTVSVVQLDETTTVTHGVGRESWEEEVDSFTTWYGQMTRYLSLVVAIWAGFAASTMRLDAGWGEWGWITFRSWFTGLSILSLFALLSDLAIPPDSARWLQVIQNLLSLGLTVGVAYLCHRWWKIRTKSLKVEPE